VKASIVRRNKRRLSYLLRLSVKNDLLLADTISLVRQSAKLRMDRRLEKRHGSYVDWDNAEKFVVGITVPVCFCHNHQTLSYRVYTSASELPINYAYLSSLFDK